MPFYMSGFPNPNMIYCTDFTPASGHDSHPERSMRPLSRRAAAASFEALPVLGRTRLFEESGPLPLLRDHGYLLSRRFLSPAPAYIKNTNMSEYEDPNISPSRRHINGRPYS